MNMCQNRKYSQAELEKIYYASKIVGYCHFRLSSWLKPGISTAEINSFVNQIIISKGAISGFKDYDGFPDIVCIAINDCILHGIDKKQVLQVGDIISIDIGVNYQGYFGDSAWTYPIGQISKRDKALLKYTEEALQQGIKRVYPGRKAANISRAIEGVAKKHSLSVIPDFSGHGVGKNLHEDPNIYNVYYRDQQDILKLDSVIAIEPIFKLGNIFYNIDPDDGWSVYASDQQNAAHFEHTVHVAEHGPIILTKQEDWDE